MNDPSIRTTRPDEISIAVNWAETEGWNPGLADDACFAAVDPEGFLIGDLDGAPAATVSCAHYSASFAFVEQGRADITCRRGIGTHSVPSDPG